MQSRSIDVGFVPRAETLLARTEKFRTATLESGAFAWEFTDRGPNVAALREAARLGMTGIEVDRELGGLGFGFREKVRVAEILSRSSIGFAFSLLNTQNVAARVASGGGDRHRDLYLPDLLAGRRFGATALTEPEAGSDFAAIATSAVRTANGWVLNGRKAWITNAVIADVILCYAQTDPDRGRDGIACFVVDGRRNGFEATGGYDVVSGATIGVGGFSLDGYEAAEDDMIVEPGSGFRQALIGVNGARIYVAAMACAAVRAALGQAVEYGSTRESFGQPILHHQGLAWSLAGVANRLEAAEALTARAVDRHDESRAALDGGGDAGGAVRLGALAAAHAKKFATEMIEPALETCMQAMGAEGLRAEHVAGRLLSESRILGYVDGTTEMQTEHIGRSLPTFYGSDSPGMVSVATPSTAAPTESGSSPVIDLSEPDGAVADSVPGSVDDVADAHLADSDQVDEAPEPPADAVPAGEADQPDDTEPWHGSGPSEDVEPSDLAEPSEARRFMGTPGWSPDPFTRSHQGTGLFADPAVDDGPDPESLSDHESVDHEAIAVNSGGADDTTLDDATRTMEFEPTGDIAAAGSSFAAQPTSSTEPPAEDPPLAFDPPMPPTEPPLAAVAGTDVPSAPPMPPPPTGDPAGFAAPLPPPPPVGPPLSTEPPLRSEPPMPPGPGARFESADRPPDAAVPPVPPPEFQYGAEPAPTAPPLPGDEHRLDADQADQPSTPPLPPESMRTTD